MSEVTEKKSIRMIKPKKEIAMKPVPIKPGKRPLICPVCKSYASIYDSDFKRVNYCSNCGQKIDWSDALDD